MTSQQWEPLVAAIIAALAALAAFLQSRTNKTKITAVDVKLDGNLTTFIQRIDQLTAALTAAGVDVPPARRDGPPAPPPLPLGPITPPDKLSERYVSVWCIPHGGYLMVLQP